jgi:MoaA/NifB/PqqE/SkfB family radical SAM enzyme
MTENAKKKIIENKKRSSLQKEKPEVYEKMIKLADMEKLGLPTSRIDLGYNYACNLKCSHCMAMKFQRKQRSLDLKDVRSIAEQAHAKGWCQFNIAGGEPLIFKDFDKVLEALMPDKFHIGISTNGYFMTDEKARQLKEAGLDKVMISVDSYDEELHNCQRGKDNAYSKAFDAIWAAKNAGLDVVLQTVITHQNCRTDSTVNLAKFAQENDFSLDLVLAKAIGEWEGRHEILIDEDDAKFMRDLHEEYPAARRNVFAGFGMKQGCGAIKKCFHISQYGDVFPCVFIHVSIGNIFRDSLDTIVSRGMKIKYFRTFAKTCLSGENRHFIDKYMSKFYGKPLPIDYREMFSERSDYAIEDGDVLDPELEKHLDFISHNPGAEIDLGERANPARHGEHSLL